VQIFYYIIPLTWYRTQCGKNQIKKMETLILNSDSQEDLQLLLDIAKKLGLDLRIADRQALIMA
jgi:hypothetical protein